MNNQTPLIFLEIAKMQLSAIRRIRGNSTRADHRKHQNAAVALITSACAVESLVNILLSAPLLVLKTVNKRKYYSICTAQLLKQSIRQKIKIVAAFVPIKNPMKKRLNELFSIRNQIIHASPKFVEEKYVPDELFERGGSVDPELLPTKPAIILHSFSPEYLNHAETAFQTAKEFVTSIDINEFLANVIKDQPIFSSNKALQPPGHMVRRG